MTKTKRKKNKKEKARSPQYVLNDPDGLNRDCYRNMNADGLFRRAQAIEYVLADRVRFAEFLQSGSRWQDAPRDGYLRSLEADLHFLEVHQAEVLFAHLFAPCQRGVIHELAKSPSGWRHFL